MISPAYIFLLFVAKEQAKMAVPWETQIQCQKVFLLNKYWQNNQMNHADKCFCTFSMFSGHLVSSVWLPIKSHLLHKCGQVTTWNCYVQAKQQHLQGSAATCYTEEMITAYVYATQNMLTVSHTLTHRRTQTTKEFLNWPWCLCWWHLWQQPEVGHIWDWRQWWTHSQ